MDKLLVFDGDFLLYYSTCPVKLHTEVIDEEGNIQYILQKDENGKQLYRDRSLDECILAVDDILRNIFIKTCIFSYIGYLGGSRCFRHDIDKSYKANRVKLIKPTFIKEVKQYLINKYGFIVVDEIEADDAVNICKRQLTDDFDCYIVSPDKDILKCIEGTHFNPKKMEWVETSYKEAQYNFWASMITGDTIDGIKGIPGRGIKFVEKNFQDVETHDLKQLVQGLYKLHFGEYSQKEFNRNYNLLNIIDGDESFQVPQPNDIRKYELPLIEEMDLELDCIKGDIIIDE